MLKGLSLHKCQGAVAKESSGLMTQSADAPPGKQGGREPKVLVQKEVWKPCGLYPLVVLIVAS